MNPPAPTDTFTPINIVLADANVLYSRVLRDYLLYASVRRLITIRWSQRILNEMSENLIKNLPNFDHAAADALTRGMSEFFPNAMVEPTAEHYEVFRKLHMPDEDDRHVVAAGIAAGANILCTSNIKDFPADVMKRAGIQLVTPDMLLTSLAVNYPDKMEQIHQTSVASLKGATDESTLAALERADPHHKPPQRWPTYCHSSSFVPTYGRGTSFVPISADADLLRAGRSPRIVVTAP